MKYFRKFSSFKVERKKKDFQSPFPWWSKNGILESRTDYVEDQTKKSWSFKFRKKPELKPVLVCCLRASLQRSTAGQLDIYEFRRAQLKSWVINDWIEIGFVADLLKKLFSCLEESLNKIYNLGCFS